MANLLETIRKNRSALATEQAPLTDETQRTQELLQAKTGKALGPSETATSNIAEQVAVGGTQAQIQQLGQQLQQQQAAEDIEGLRQTQQERLQRGELDQARKFQTIQTKMETNKLLNELQRDKATLDLEKDKSRLEQTAFLLAMQDKRYVDNLQAVGRRNRFDNQQQFNEELQKQIMGIEVDFLKTKLNQSDILAASDRDFREMLAGMSFADAQAIAQMEMQYDQTVAQIKAQLMREGVSAQAAQAAAETQAAGAQSIVKGAIKAGETYAKSSEDSDTDTEEADTGKPSSSNTGQRDFGGVYS